MKTRFLKTKRRMYIQFGEEVFSTNNNWSDITFTNIQDEKLNEQQKEAINSQYGWESLGDCESLEDAYYKAIEVLKEQAYQRKIESSEMEKKIAERKLAEWNSIKDLEVIPSTLENIRIVLQYLNEENWGSWSLPKMSIGYAAHQYDCDGKIAATITLNKPVDGSLKFKVGGKIGHLNKYRAL